jgi:hypothetical protein
MKFINSKRFWILNSLILGFVVLQILDFPTFDYPLLIDIAKFIIFISVIFFAFRYDAKWRKKLLVVFVYLLLIAGTYLGPIWKFKTNIWLSNIEKEYSQVVDIIDDHDSFSFIIYDKSGDSLKINPTSFRDQYTNKELDSFKSFLKRNYYLELWGDEKGVVMVYSRFLDNRAGFILCQEKQCREAMNAANQNNKDYYPFNENWYRYYAY